MPPPRASGTSPSRVPSTRDPVRSAGSQAARKRERAIHPVRSRSVWFGRGPTLAQVRAALAALLAAVGAYGAIAFSVAQRTREFGLRVALGAMPGAIRRLTLVRTARLTLAGALAGLGVSLILGRLLRSALYLVPHRHPGLIHGVNIADPVSLVAAALIVLALAALAALGPAGRAAAADPMAALRNE